MESKSCRYVCEWNTLDSNGKQLSPDTVNRMVSYFARHEVDKQ